METKICPLCAEAIKTAAKVCPFCHQRQDGRGRWLDQATLVNSVLVLWGLGLTCLAGVYIDYRFGGRDFARHRGDLLVVGTALHPPQAKAGFWLTGYVTNQSNHPWRVQELEVRFVDAHGALLDASHPDLKEGFVVQPHREGAFKVGLAAPSITNAEIACQARVEAASEEYRVFGSRRE